MSGFAHVTGQPDGPPTLPPFMLADGVASLAATYAVMMALYHRDVHGGRRPAHRREPDRAAGPAHRVGDPGLRPARRRPGPGRQPLPTPARPATPTAPRTTGGSPSPARRRTSPSACSGPSAAPDLAEDPDYVDPVRRQARAAEVDDLVATWVGERTLDEAMAVFEAAEVAAAPVYDAEQLLADEHLQARGTFVPRRRPRLRRGHRPGPGGRSSARPRGGSSTSAGRWAPTTTPSTAGSSGSSADQLADLRVDGRHLMAPSPGPGAPSWPRRPAARRCARRRRRRAPTWCSSTSRTPAPRRPRRAPGRSRSPRSPSQDWGRTVRAVRVNGLDTPGATTTSSRSSPAPARRSTSSSCPRPARPGTSGGSTSCSPSWRPSSACSKRIGLEVLIEEAEGLANAVEIARASDRLEAIIFGAGDLSASQHARVDGNFDPVSEYPGDFWHFARVQVVTAARVAGIDAIDAPYPAYQDPDGYRRSGHPRQPARLRRQVGHPPLARSRSPTRSSPPPRRGDRGRRAVGRDLPGGGGRGRGRHRPRRPARRRRPHAPGREHAAQGRARRGQTRPT